MQALDLLDAFLIHAAGRPLLLALAFSAAAGLWTRQRRAFAGGAADHDGGRGISAFVAAMSLAGLVAYAAVALWYASDDRYFDAAEPTMTIVGWLFTLGQPLYHDPASAERYAHIYGPLAFIAHGVVQSAAGASVVASKALGVAAGLTGVLATWLAVASGTTRRRAAVVTGAGVLVYLAFRNVTFWTRPDGLIVAAVATGLLITLRTRGVVGALGLGLTIAALASLKFTGVLYAAPLLALLLAGGRTRHAMIAAVTGGAMALAPFALANVSLASYLAWIRLSAGNGLMLAMLRQNIEWSAFLLLPLGLAWFAIPADARIADRRWRAFVVALLAAMAGVAVAAAKPGAGPYHLLPFVPLIAWATGLIIARHPLFGSDRAAAPAAFGWIVAGAAMAIAYQASFIRIMQDARGRDEAADVRRFLDEHPGTVAQMAYSGYDRPTFARAELTFRSGLYLVDAPAVQEHQLSRLPFPDATLAAIRTCRVDVWLVPHGTEPFTGPNRYPVLRLAPIFPDDVRAAFHQSYAPAGRTRFFDVWRCRPERRP